MAVYVYALTNALALDEVPGPAANIDATSTPVDDDQVTGWLEDAAGIVTSTLESRGVDYDGLSDDNIRVAQRAIKAFVAYKVLQAHGDDAAQAYFDEYNMVLETLRDRPELLGDGENDDAAVETNIDITDPKVRKFSAYNDDRGDGWTGW